MTREASQHRHAQSPDFVRPSPAQRPEPGWFLHESDLIRQPAAPFEPQIDEETVRDYWRARIQSFSHPPDIDAEAAGAARMEDGSDDADGDYGQPLQPAPGAGSRMPGAAFAAATVLALSIGGIGGFIALDRVSAGGMTAPAMAWLHALWSGGAPAGPQQILAAAAPLGGNKSVKSVLTATLDMADVQGEAKALIPLRLIAESGLPGRDIAVKIEGLPSHARLTAGTRIGGTWLLRREEIDDIRLMVPEPTAAPLVLAISAIEPETGAMASPVKEVSVAIMPVAPAVEAAASLTPAEQGAASEP